MRKILFLTFGLFFAITSYGQDSLRIDSLSTEKDSVKIGSHSEFSTNRLEDATKMEGDSAYKKNDFAAAVQIYETVLKKGDAADIYYNLGNSYYKLGDIANAILNYERALLLEPGDNDIRANLDVARSKTIDKVDAIPEVFFVTWIKALVNSMGVDAWAKCGIIFFILLIISLYFFIFSKRILWKKTGFVTGIVSLLIVVLANVFAAEQKEILTKRDSAVVMSPSVTVRSTPSENGTSLFILHEGHKVSIKDNSMKEWKEIRLEDGKVGWLPSSTIEII